jgi:hypothetical protein
MVNVFEPPLEMKRKQLFLMARQRLSMVVAAAVRRCVLRLQKSISMGLKSGL